MLPASRRTQHIRADESSRRECSWRVNRSNERRASRHFWLACIFAIPPPPLRSFRVGCNTERPPEDKRRLFLSAPSLAWLSACGDVVSLLDVGRLWSTAGAHLSSKRRQGQFCVALCADVLRPLINTDVSIVAVVRTFVYAWHRIALRLVDVYRFKRCSAEYDSHLTGECLEGSCSVTRPMA